MRNSAIVTVCLCWTDGRSPDGCAGHRTVIWKQGGTGRPIFRIPKVAQSKYSRFPHSKVTLEFDSRFFSTSRTRLGTAVRIRASQSQSESAESLGLREQGPGRIENRVVNLRAAVKVSQSQSEPDGARALKIVTPEARTERQQGRDQG